MNESSPKTIFFERRFPTENLSILIVIDIYFLEKGECKIVFYSKIDFLTIQKRDYNREFLNYREVENILVYEMDMCTNQKDMFKLDQKCASENPNLTNKLENMIMFVNGMQQPGDTQQYLFEIKDDQKNGSYVFNRLIQLNNESKWYFVVSDQDFVGMNSSVEALQGDCLSSYKKNSESSESACNSKMEQNLALKMYFQENMIDENRWPRKNCDREEMKKMTFLVNYLS